MRTVLVAALLVAVPGTAGAQTSASSTAQPPSQSIGLPLAHIGLPLPSIGLPVPPMGLPPIGASTPPSILNAFRGPRVPPRGGRANRRSVVAGNPFVFIPAFGWPYVPDSLLPGTAVPSLPTPPP